MHMNGSQELQAVSFSFADISNPNFYHLLKFISNENRGKLNSGGKEIIELLKVGKYLKFTVNVLLSTFQTNLP